MKYDYFIIFDTNVLYHAYDKRGDFTVFKFNNTYENIVGIINQLDIYDKVTLVIPIVVWNEMKNQIINAHEEKLKQIKQLLERFNFPEIKVEEIKIENYSDYIEPVIQNYKKTLSSDINKVIDLSIATNNRYDSIVQRAFSKRPPFEGKDRKSDKGFKDTLLWESIIEFAENKQDCKIIYYSKDNIFNEELEKEFISCYEEKVILYICKNEEEVKNKLEEWAKEIDIYSYSPIQNYNEFIEIKEWIESSEFVKELNEISCDFIENSRLLKSVDRTLIKINNIDCDNDSETIRYNIEGILRINYVIKSKNNILDFYEDIVVNIIVDSIDNEIFRIYDIYEINYD